MNVRVPFSDLASKSKSSLKTGLSILLYSLGKTNSMSSSWLNRSLDFDLLTGFLIVRLTIRTTVLVRLLFDLVDCYLRGFGMRKHPARWASLFAVLAQVGLSVFAGLKEWTSSWVQRL